MKIYQFHLSLKAKDLLLILLLIFLPFSLQARKIHSSSILATSIPVTGATYSATISDEEGLKQLFYSLVVQQHTTIFLKKAVKKRRPDGSNHKSFISHHTSTAFSGASYLHNRYGWNWGVPAYLLSSAIAYERIDKDKHYLVDVLLGAAVGYFSSALFTRKYPKVWIDPKYDPKKKQASVNFNLSFS